MESVKMKKILTYRISQEEEEKLRKICLQTGIGMSVIPEWAVTQEIGVLAGKDFTDEDKTVSEEEKKVTESILIFCSLTDKQLDHVLEKLREAKIRPDYKAVMTQTNRNWSLYHLSAEMQREKSAYAEMERNRSAEQQNRK